MRVHKKPELSCVPNDEALVRQALTRDAAAFGAIMRRHNRRLYRIARSILRNESEAEDAVQETYIKAFTHLQGFRAESSLSTWLSRIAAHAIADLRQ
jgi:RNA polymerase sigma-70 factor (ECF subfamily)